MKNILLILTIITALFSCKKNDVEPSQLSPEQALKNLTDKYFIRTAATSNTAFPIGGGVTTTDIYHDWYKDPCLLDDLRMFKSNGDFIYDNGATKCQPYEDQVFLSKWAFIENSTKIEETRGTFKDTLTILINDGTILKYEHKYIKPASPTVYIFTETWHVK